MIRWLRVKGQEEVDQAVDICLACVLELFNRLVRVFQQLVYITERIIGKSV